MVDEFLNVPWLIYGDFNMVENTEDKEGILPVRVLYGEKEVWIAFIKV